MLAHAAAQPQLVDLEAADQMRTGLRRVDDGMRGIDRRRVIGAGALGHFIEKLRVYVAAENLITFTKYWGFDPEVASSGTSLGVDYGVYPQARVFTVGLNLSF